MRHVVWFSCGAASAVVAKITLEKYPDTCEIVYCDTLAYEHPDNIRFLKDCEKWFGKEIKIIRSEKYKDIYEVFNKGWLVGIKGAACTTEMKRIPRKKYQIPGDVNVWGYTFEEKQRIDRYLENNIDDSIFPLYENKITKQDCHTILNKAGIEQPTMYKLGYKNNNCIGCVKGAQGYWNKIRVDFPEIFEKMAKLERRLNVSVNKKYVKKKRIRVFLDELPIDAGRYEQEADITCGVICEGLNDEEENK